MKSHYSATVNPCLLRIWKSSWRVSENKWSGNTEPFLFTAVSLLSTSDRTYERTSFHHSFLCCLLRDQRRTTFAFFVCFFTGCPQTLIYWVSLYDLLSLPDTNLPTLSTLVFVCSNAVETCLWSSYAWLVYCAYYTIKKWVCGKESREDQLANEAHGNYFFMILSKIRDK